MKKQDSAASAESPVQRLLDRLDLFERRMTIRLGLMLVAVAGLSLGIAKLLF